MALFWTAIILLSGVVAYVLSVKGIGPAFLFAHLRDRYVNNVLRKNAYDSNGYIKSALSVYASPMQMESDISTQSKNYENEKDFERDTHRTEELDSVLKDSLQNELKDRAIDDGVLVSDGGADYLLLLSEGNRSSAYALLERVIAEAREAYPREDGWLHLNRERIRLILNVDSDIEKDADAVPSNLPFEGASRYSVTANHARTSEISSEDLSKAKEETLLFIGLMCNGKREEAFRLIRGLHSRGLSGQEFVMEVVATLDDVYRSRLEGGQFIEHPMLAHVRKFSNQTLECLAGILANGVDYSYRDSNAGIKVALLRAFLYMDKQRVE